MKNIIFTIITIFSYFLSTGQQLNSLTLKNLNDLPKEKIFIHSNSNFLLTGETLYYKVYCLNRSKNSLSRYSKVAYVELINSKNKSIVKQKVNLIKSSGYGDFFLNTTIKTGAYKLISYTQWMRNEQLFYEEDVFIINPFSQKIKKGHNLKENLNIFKNPDSIYASKNIKIYSRREKASLDIPINIQKNTKNFSVSIRKKERINFQRKNNYRLTLNNIQKERSNYFHLPELRGSLIKGKIISKNSKKNKVSNIKLSLSVKNDNNLPKTAITNELGEFYFNIKNIKNSIITIQILNDNFNDYHINLNSNNLIEKKFTNFKELHLNDVITKVIKDRSLNLQIENAYYSVKRDSTINKKANKEYFKGIRKIYFLDDYKRFTTVTEVFLEIIDQVKLSKKNGNYKLHVFNSTNEKTTTNIPSLLIIDGNIIYNHNDFINLNANRINKISVINSKYFYGNGIYQGVVIIDTFKGDFLPNAEQNKIFTILKPQPQKKYFFQKHDIPELTKRIPDYRTQLYWNPDIKSNAKNITFYTSDVTGEFEIEIQGITDKGKDILIKSTFTVK